MKKLTTAEEMRKLAEAARAEKARLMQEEVEAFVENLIPAMEEAAQQGRNWLPKIQLPSNFFFKGDVKKRLEELGYRVEDAIAINCINIYWDIQKTENEDAFK